MDPDPKQLRLPVFFLARQEIADTVCFRFLLTLASHWANLEGSVTWQGAPSGDVGRRGAQPSSPQESRPCCADGLRTATHILVRTAASDRPHIMLENISLIVWEVPVLKRYQTCLAERSRGKAPSPALL